MQTSNVFLIYDGILKVLMKKNEEILVLGAAE